MSFKHLNKLSIIPLLTVFLLSIPSILALVHPGFFQSDDGGWMIIRFSAFHEAFRSGQIPIRFLTRLNYGYGYPVVNFLYPGFMYLAEPLKLMGFNFTNTIRILLILSLTASSLFAFLWLSKLFGLFASLVGALFYLYTPYHLYDVYKRGSVGEILALAVLPFILWQFERKSVFWSAIGIGILLISHNSLSLLFFPIIVLYPLIGATKKSRPRSYLLEISTILGLGLSAFFWIPALLELPLTRFATTRISNPFAYFATFPMLGLSGILVLISSFFFVLFSKQKKSGLYFPAVLFLAIAFLSLFFSLPISGFAWEKIPSSYIQFPFRMLSVFILCTSFLSAFCISRVRGIQIPVAGILFFGLLIYSAYPILSGITYSHYPDSFYTTNEDTTTVHAEYMPVWVKQKATSHAFQKVEIPQNAGTIGPVSSNGKRILFTARLLRPSLISVNAIYYPGWKVFVNGAGKTILYTNPKGIMQLQLPSGQSRVRLEFFETPLRLFADMVSLLSLIILVAGQIICNNIKLKETLS